MRAEHRFEFVADIIDQDAAFVQDALRQHAQDIVDPLHGPRRAQPLGHAAETTNVAHQDGYFEFLAQQKLGMGGELACQFRREELLELNAATEGSLLLLDARQTGGYAAGEQFDQHRFELGYWTANTLGGMAAIAIECADYVAVAVEDGGGDHGADAHQAFRGRSGDLPEGAFFLLNLAQDLPARGPFGGGRVAGAYLTDLQGQVPFSKSSTRPASRPTRSTTARAARAKKS